MSSSLPPLLQGNKPRIGAQPVRGFFDGLVAFYQRLADNQQDLPADAARLLRENLWQLYD